MQIVEYFQLFFQEDADVPSQLPFQEFRGYRRYGDVPNWRREMCILLGYWPNGH